MPLSPAINTTVRITAKDINNNSVAKQYNAVRELHFDYNDGTVNIVDKTGSFYFPIMPMTTVTYTITAGVSPTVVIVMS